MLSCVGCIVLSKCVVLSSYSACPDCCQVDRLSCVGCVVLVECIVLSQIPAKSTDFAERSDGVATPQCVVCGVTTAGERCCCAAGYTITVYWCNPND